MAIHERIASVISKSGLSLPEFAKRVGVTRNTIVRYRDGKISPSVAFMETMAQEFKIDRSWLILGEKGDRPDIDVDVLTQVISGVRKSLDEKGLELPTEKEAELIVLLYDHFSHSGKPVNDATVERYLRLVS
mgnify:CR=1 FL=1